MATRTDRDHADTLRRMARSYSPWQWWERQYGNFGTAYEMAGGEVMMWVYRRVGDYYEVGFYDPKGEWHCDTVYDATDEGKEQAAARCRWLNGGN